MSEVPMYGPTLHVWPCAALLARLYTSFLEAKSTLLTDTHKQHFHSDKTLLQH